jgi:hypothetical protein
VDQKHVDDLEMRVDRLERGFRYMPFALLAVISVAVAVFLLFVG